MKLYAVINKNEFVGDAYVIYTEIKSAKNAFDNYTVNPGRTILAEIEQGKDFGFDAGIQEFWGGEVLLDHTNEPDDWGTLHVFPETQGEE